ncbi:hypothetical protein LB557_06610 [Mesorhizobium sp. BR115XR7A]|uniref:hypothetical protein n=1 Tax=Mesorhizobium sp. BR115XR7A TaxID=2876645 RepID=UPI001CCCAC0D|nr:hypothetical protein [Mesorhizobium sp. BR115XR7A]MBZ9905666.1 hypothetical protein [Mesorhizobium sp. BR115XR7A]MBZ9931760.1 hypothetical protein [Mesorhizobium sp. BR1-1-5]
MPVLLKHAYEPFSAALEHFNARQNLAVQHHDHAIHHSLPGKRRATSISNKSAAIGISIKKTSRVLSGGSRPQRSSSDDPVYQAGLKPLTAGKLVNKGLGEVAPLTLRCLRFQNQILKDVAENVGIERGHRVLLNVSVRLVYIALAQPLKKGA